MMNVFTSKFENCNIRFITKEDDSIWVIAKDICDYLELRNPRQVISILDDTQKGVHTMDTLGGTQIFNIVNESGLYELIFRSRKPEARKFRRWVCEEVLPSIRKQGKYELQKKIDMFNLYTQAEIEFQAIKRAGEICPDGWTRGREFNECIDIEVSSDEDEDELESSSDEDGIDIDSYSDEDVKFNPYTMEYGYEGIKVDCTSKLINEDYRITITTSNCPDCGNLLIPESKSFNKDYDLMILKCKKCNIGNEFKVRVFDQSNEESSNVKIISRKI